MDESGYRCRYYDSMINWKKMPRLTELHRILVKGRPFTLRQMAERFDVSTKSIARDLHDMRDKLRLPVEYDPINETWKYTGEVAEFPALLIDGQDRRALLFSLYAAGQLDNTPVSGSVKDVYRRLLETLGPSRAGSFEKVMQRVVFAGELLPAIPGSVWDVVLLSMEDQTTMHIHYTDGAYGSHTSRDFDPYALIMRDHRWLLVGYCHWREQVLTLAMHRISEAQSTEKSFKVTDREISEYLARGFAGYPSTGEEKRVRLRIAKDAPPYVLEKCWMPSETRRVDAEGNTIIEFHTTAVWAVGRQVLAEGGLVDMLEPADARECVRETAARMVAVHSCATHNEQG